MTPIIDKRPFPQTLVIKKGPSKLDIMFALFDDRPESEPAGRALIFKGTMTKPPKTKEYTTFREYEDFAIAFHIFKLERSEGNPEWWDLWGTAHIINGDPKKEVKVHIVFCTDKREGMTYLI